MLVANCIHLLFGAVAGSVRGGGGFAGEQLPAVAETEQ